MTAAGYQTGLSFVVNPQPDDYHSSLHGFYGIKVMLHYPYNYPDRSVESQLIGLGVQNFLGISPEVTYSSQGVLKLPIEDRDCINNAKDLPLELLDLSKNFTWIKYTYPNCLNECRVNKYNHRRVWMRSLLHSSKWYEKKKKNFFEDVGWGILT